MLRVRKMRKVTASRRISSSYQVHIDVYPMGITWSNLELYLWPVKRILIHVEHTLLAIIHRDGCNISYEPSLRTLLFFLAGEEARN